MTAARVRRVSRGIYQVVILTDPLGEVWSSEPNYRSEHEFLSTRDAKIFQSNAHAAIGRANKTIRNTALVAA